MDQFTARERVTAALDEIDAAYAVLRSTSTAVVGNAFRVEVAARLEGQDRLNRGLSYRLVAELFDPPDGDDGGPPVRDRLADRLRVTRNEIARRARLAARIRPRRSLTGPPLPPLLAILAAAVEAGLVGEDHIGAVVKALDTLPKSVPADEVVRAEKVLVKHAITQDAAFVTAVGRKLADTLNPDGLFDEHDRAARRGLTLSPQGPDGMSKLSGQLTPAARAYLEAVGAAVRPGHHLPGSDQVVVDTTTDTRTPSQRLHDGFEWGLRTGIESGNLGQHRGIPVTVIATTTLTALNQAIHAIHDPNVPIPAPARTGGGSSLPMRDLITMAAGSVHYLAVFDDHTNRPLYLGRSRRIATLDQRLICYARDGGCTRPNCTVSGYHCEVHHAPRWEPDGTTDANKLWFACGPDNQAEADGHYRTTITNEGRLSWTDGTKPPQINHLHHPEELLNDNDP